MRTSTLLLITGTSLLHAIPALAAPPTFELLPSFQLGGRGYVAARGISGDGQVITGSETVKGFERPFVWRRSNGVWQLHTLPVEGSGFKQGRAMSLSFNGDTIVGMTNQYYVPAHASGTPAIWTNVLSGTPTLSTPFDDDPDQVRRGLFSGVSADGLLTSGYAPLRQPTSSPSEFWLATAGLPARLSPFPTTDGYTSAILAGNPISADGSIIVGTSGQGSTKYIAFRWSADTGFVQLDTPTTGDFIESRAETISRDGLVIGGHLYNYGDDYASSHSKPSLWTTAGRADLPVLPSRGDYARVVGLSPDGSVALGIQYYHTLELDPVTFTTDATAIFWIDEQVYSAEDYLKSRGVDLHGYRPRWLTSIADDGLTIVGFASHSDHTWSSFIMTLGTPCEADLNGDGVVDFADYLEFLNLFDALDPHADFNHDGIVDFADYLEFLNLFDAGC